MYLAQKVPLLCNSQSISISSLGSALTDSNDIYIFGDVDRFSAHGITNIGFVGKYQKHDTVFEGSISSFEDDLDVFIETKECFYDHVRVAIYIACVCITEEDERYIYFFEYSIPHQRWKKLTTFPTRSGAVVEYLSTQHSFIVFGGIGNTRRFNDIQQYHIETNTWEQLPPFWDDIFTDASSAAESSTSSTNSPTESNTISIPTPRHSSCHCLVRNEQELFIFGGNGKNSYLSYWNDNKFLDDSYAYHFGTQKWRALHTNYQKPSPRISASCLYLEQWDAICLIGGTNTAQVFGEVFLFLLSQQSWMKLETVFPTSILLTDKRIRISMCNQTSHIVNYKNRTSPIEIVSIGGFEDAEETPLYQLTVLQLWTEQAVKFQSKLFSSLKQFADVLFVHL